MKTLSFATAPRLSRSGLTRLHGMVPTPSDALLAVSVGDQVIIAIRLVWAGLAGGIVGLERSRRRGRRGTVGPRTISLVSIGAALFTVAGCFAPGGDPTRLAASAASGVGFIGAGVISVEGDGLTTAASIWCAAALGVASGVGLGFTVTIGTAIAVAVLESSHVFNQMRRHRLQQERRNSSPLA
mmetsp:Transcript_12435/g.40690  ORF Transcript_12435/g.40690 Transcript_12435/m.40690 type:complete len:184 (+) Transcript_12435:176-727(+)